MVLFNSVGAHVRDAACYVCWAFARAYSPVIIRPFVRELADAMIVVALFDREVQEAASCWTILLAAHIKTNAGEL